MFLISKLERNREELNLCNAIPIILYLTIYFLFLHDYHDLVLNFWSVL